MTTTVKKGCKIGKLVTTPKRSSYAFKGWYTKKSGGTKITKNTKPKKSATLYAQWQKKTSSSSGSDSIVGGWTGHGSYSFKADGTFVTVVTEGAYTKGASGKYYTSGGKLYLTDIVEYYKQGPLKDRVWEYCFGTDQYGKYVMLKLFSFTDFAPDSTKSYKFHKGS